MKWFDDILKRIPDSALNVIGLLSGIITILNILYYFKHTSNFSKIDKDGVGRNLFFFAVD